MHGQNEEAREPKDGHRQPGASSSAVLACEEDTRRQGLRDLNPQASAYVRSRGFVVLVWVVMVAAKHSRGLYRPRPSRNLTDLTLYEPPLLAALGKFPVKPLQALLLDVQPAREGVEAFERSPLQPILELAFPGISRPSQRQGDRTLLPHGLLWTEELFGRNAQRQSQLVEGAKMRTPYLAGLDAGDSGGTNTGLPSQPRLGPHPQATCALHSPAYLGHAHTSSLSTTNSLP